LKPRMFSHKPPTTWGPSRSPTARSEQAQPKKHAQLPSLLMTDRSRSRGLRHLRNTAGSSSPPSGTVWREVQGGKAFVSGLRVCAERCQHPVCVTVRGLIPPSELARDCGHRRMSQLGHRWKNDDTRVVVLTECSDCSSLIERIVDVHWGSMGISGATDSRQDRPRHKGQDPRNKENNS